MDAKSRLNRAPDSKFHALLRLAEGVPVAPFIAELKARGVEFYTPGGRRLQVGLRYPARVPFALIEDLKADPRLRALDAFWAGPQPFYTDAAPALIEAKRKLRPRTASGAQVTGSGITVGVIDGDLDVLHPAFFHADAGLYEWEDVDGDGVLTPELDAVVMEEGPIASLRVLQSPLMLDFNGTYNPQEVPGSSALQLDVDYFYLDLNGNGVRDVGRAAGFDETTPAYGEPLFIADDVNGDGIIQSGEKLLRLGTSKLRVYYTPGNGAVYWRGIDLIDVPRPEVSSHGTMTVGILAGGHASQRFHGVAPDIDIVYVDYLSGGQAVEGSPIAAALAFVEQEQVDVVMHEYGWPIGQFGDGSSEIEGLIDTLSQTGQVHVTAAHNYAFDPMHAVATVEGEQSLDFPIQVGTDFTVARYLYLSMRWRDAADPVGFTLELPDGSTFEVGPSPEDFWDGETNLSWSGISTSSRGTKLAMFTLGRTDGVDWIPLVTGEAFLSVHTGPTDPVTIDLFVADETGYLRGAAVVSHLTPEGTVSHPGTADTAITVGAFQANVEIPGLASGEHSFYSGQGPRIDGELALDISAPSDGLGAAVIPSASSPALSSGGGTSGALPQVTGVVALSRQVAPDMTPEALKLTIQSTGLTDGFTGTVPNNLWGFGKVSAAGVWGHTVRPNNAAPQAVITLLEPAYLNEPLRLSAELSTDADDAGDSLRVRWDAGYTGSYEPATALDVVKEIPAVSVPTDFVWVVEVFDPSGASSRQLVEVSVNAVRPEPEPEPEAVPDVVSEPEDTSDKSGSLLPANDSGCSGSKGPFPFGLIVLLLIGWMMHRLFRRRSNPGL